ncbi:hypothetical protein [Stenotrophomonas sp.]|uniref:hypothetical protein n=1 Tax=Stenotrophomonas sp. TaxID=69392 RepID=UPI0028A70CAE|nr:hypothetical protein [Stenotrophomonas sp.]
MKETAHARPCADSVNAMSPRALHIAVTLHALVVTHAWHAPLSLCRIDATMPSVQFSVPAVINVDAEVNYWRQRHADGLMGEKSFGQYITWIKFACDSLISHPRHSDSERLEAFQTFYALQIMPRLTEAEASAFVDQVWDHLYMSSRSDRAERPRLIAASA